MWDNLMLKYNQLDISGKLISWITAATLSAWLLQLLGIPMVNWLAVPAGWRAVLKPWSFLTYGFLHSGILHLLFNMLMLYYAGRMVLNLLSGRFFLSLFFSGVLIGAAVFVLATYIAPLYIGMSPMVGASAGVYALLMFTCFYMPETEVRIIAFNIKLKHIAYALLVYAVFNIFARLNAGGNVAHLAGAFIGWYTAIKLKEGDDIMTGVASVGDSIVNLFSSKKTVQPKKRKTKMRTVHKTTASSKPAATAPNADQEKIDAILDKISSSGYESLSKAEKEYLFKAGK